MMTVIFATRDRADGLRDMLEVLTTLQPPAGGWKLVVADNGSSDGTAAVLENYASRLPLTSVHEPVAGKNRALNRALGHVEGDLCVLTDDDVVPDRDWLVQLRAAAASQPAASMFGGTVVPLWPPGRPDFISEWAVNFSVLYAQNEQPTGWCESGMLFGPNMAVRAQVFQDGFRFSEDIGPNNSQLAYVMGSETDFVNRLALAGHRAWFAAEARVQHVVRPDQLTERWILKRYYLYGLQAQRNARIRPPYAGGRRVVWSACAPLARLAPPSQPRLRILARERFFAGLFAPPPQAVGSKGP